MSDEIDFTTEHPKADMSGVDRIRVNGKVYLAADRVLEILDAEATKIELGGYGKVHGKVYMEEVRAVVEALKGGKDEVH